MHVISYHTGCLADNGSFENRLDINYRSDLLLEIVKKKKKKSRAH